MEKVKICNTIFISLMGLVLTSCGGGFNPSNAGNSNNDPSNSGITSVEDNRYKVSSEEYSEQMHREYVLFKSNYTINVEKDGNPYAQIEMDHGLINSQFFPNAATFYELVDLGNRASMTYVEPTGRTVHQEISKQDLYSYFFFDYDLLFDISFSLLTFNESDNTYVATNLELNRNGTTYNLPNVKFSFVDHKPNYMYFEIANFGTFNMIFSKVGTTEVKNNNGSYNIEVNKTYKYNSESIFEDVENYIVSVLSYYGVKNITFSSEEPGVVDVTYFKSTSYDYIDDCIDASITCQYPATFVNAHGTIATFRRTYNTYATFGELDNQKYLMIPISMIEGFDNFINEVKDDVKNTNGDYAFYYDFGDGGPTYFYPMYLFYNFDPSEFIFEEAKIGKYGDHVLRMYYYMQYFIDLLERYPGYLLLDCSYSDMDGDGILTENEKEHLDCLYLFQASMINFIPNSFALELVD